MREDVRCKMLDGRRKRAEGWTVGRLFVKHPSMPLNRSLANVFFRSGDIESWGRGYRRIVRGNEAAGLRAVEL